MTAKDYLGTLEDYSFQFSKPPPRGVKAKKYFQSTSKDYILNQSKLFTNLLEYWQYVGIFRYSFSISTKVTLLDYLVLALFNSSLRELMHLGGVARESISLTCAASGPGVQTPH